MRTDGAALSTAFTAAAVSALIVVVVIGGPASMVLAICGAVAVVLAVLFRRSPAVACVTWWLVAVLIPPWIYLTVFGFRVSVLSAISLVVVAALAGKVSLKASPVDALVLLMLTSVVAGVALAQTPAYILSQSVLEWGVCYLAGRFLFLNASFAKVAARIGPILGVLAVVQFLSNFDLAAIPPFSYSVGATNWMGLQVRAGFSRAELTFGQSIALGGVLCLVLPFVVREKVGASRIAGVLAVTAGAAVTLSRAAWLALIATMVIGVVLARTISKTTKLLALLTGGGCLALLYGPLTALLYDSGTEIQTSTDYREGLLSLAGVLRPFGVAHGAERADDGPTFRWGAFYSIDNAFLFIGLYAGAVAALCLASIYLYYLLKAVRGIGAAPVIAVVAHLPFLLTVAPITQYQSVLWLIIGAAATSIAKNVVPGLLPSPHRARVRPTRR